jgi:hypothetical protein
MTTVTFQVGHPSGQKQSLLFEFRHLLRATFTAFPLPIQ